MRISSHGQAERAYHRHHPQQHAVLEPDVHGRRDHSDRSIDGTGMDGLQVSPDQLMAADQQLAQAQEELHGHLRTARELHQHLEDGTGPVAHTMHGRFMERADDQGGVQFALRNYIAEIGNVRTAIGQALATYQTVDDDVAINLSQQSAEEA